MFTGLVREIGTVKALRRRGELTDLVLDAPASAPGLGLGDSLAVDGICLTVTRIHGGRVTVEAVAETRRITTLGGWRSGRRVHLEPALKAGDPLGGHLVLGHVDGVGKVESARRAEGGLVLRISVPPELRTQLLPKGSIAVDGVSLTLDRGPFADGFSLRIIPHTLAETRFASLRPGDLVNLETDVLAKAAARGTAPETPDERPAASGPLDGDRIRGMGFRRSGRGGRYGG